MFFAGDDALPEALQGTILLAGFLCMLVLDVLHQSVSSESVHPHERQSSSGFQGANGDAEGQQNGHFDPRPANGASGNFMTAIIVRMLIEFSKSCWSGRLFNLFMVAPCHMKLMA